MSFGETLYQTCILFISMIAVIIIVWGSLWAGAELLILEVKKILRHENSGHERYYLIKEQFGHRISLGLEFLLAADLLSLIQNPSDQEIIQLAALVAIRIAINYFLNREIAAIDLMLNRKKAAQTKAS
ncbi:MAG: hypothetical protein TR69_WS6001001484 [candidate division WS6 bacterium OLB20]|uniref:DUF1622 domain-containing protein n=1 Tax=candidate division WS6 bacterium OLB20 TaxID=1617426 RepID=A0A136LW50_9BACT|nr:MAG: hypothetical protein TR69_WS6001001484 [candidate division WS6 bacterium OLB20]